VKAATTIGKLCQVLNAFRGRPSLGLTEVAENTQFLKSDAHRILKSLEHFGFIAQDADSRRYRLGLELLKLGYLVHGRLHLCDTAMPFLRMLSETAGATANLAIFDPLDHDVVFIEQVDAPAEAPICWRIGHSAFPHATAVGKILLAHLDEPTVQVAVKRHGLVRRTRHTITEMPALMSELERVRHAGFAVDREEAVAGACCIGAPVRDQGGAVVAALSVSMTKARLGELREGDVAGLVRSTARRISGALGHRVAAPLPEACYGKGAVPQPRIGL
jgi:IclR family acetate operon transcriptional repressor